MKSTEECLEALAHGKTLVNITGGEVYLNKFGTQVIAGAGKSRKGCAYRFSHPGLWHIKETVVQPKETNWFILLGVMLVLSLVVNMALYQAYNEVVSKPSEIAELNVSLEETTKLYEEILGKLSKYEADKEYIMSLGASEDEAMKIIKASSAYGVSPK